MASESEEKGAPVFIVVHCIAAIRAAGTAYELIKINPGANNSQEILNPRMKFPDSPGS